MKLFQGRINRRTWLIASILLEGIAASFDLKIAPASFSLMSIMINILFITIGASLDMRRFHDIGKSGYFTFFTVMPVILYRIIGYVSHGFDFNHAHLGDITSFVVAAYWMILVNDVVWVAYLLFRRGDMRSNKYGKTPVPKVRFLGNL
jgi:uncharacterized membrane protein YhaH (DUF805 family)